MNPILCFLGIEFFHCVTNDFNTKLVVSNNFFVNCKWNAYPNNKFWVNHATHMKEGSDQTRKFQEAKLWKVFFKHIGFHSY